MSSLRLGTVSLIHAHAVRLHLRSCQEQFSDPPWRNVDPGPRAPASGLRPGRARALPAARRGARRRVSLSRVGACAQCRHAVPRRVSCAVAVNGVCLSRHSAAAPSEVRAPGPARPAASTRARARARARSPPRARPPCRRAAPRRERRNPDSKGFRSYPIAIKHVTSSQRMRQIVAY